MTDNRATKKKIKEAIIVEGRDDTAAVKRAVEAVTVETHGFGMPETMWAVIDKAYRSQGIIVFTDPDYAGEKIRRKITAKYPDCKQAFLPQGKALKKGDIGVENASPADIEEALLNARCTLSGEGETFTMDDLINHGLAGGACAGKRREKLGNLLSVGYGNSRTFLKKLNCLGISREEFYEKVKELE